MILLGNSKTENRNSEPAQSANCHSEGRIVHRRRTGPRNLLFPLFLPKSRFLGSLGIAWGKVTRHSLVTRHFLTLFALCLCGIPVFLFCPATHGQSLDKPSVNIDEDVTAFGFSPDGRIAYSVRRLYHNKKYDMQRDDIWLADPHGHGKRIFTGEHFTLPAPAPVASDDSDNEITDERGRRVKKHKEEKPLAPPFTYIVEGFRFSPNGRLVLVQLLTSRVTDEAARPQDERMTLVLDESGREIRLSGDNAVLHSARDATWLTDGQTIVFLTEAVQPNLLFSFKYANVRTGPAGNAFEGRTFIASVPIPNSNTAIAIERDRNMSGPPRLQRLELLSQDDKELATLDGYETGLSVSPSGKRVAYFVDKEVLEVRDLQNPNRLARVRIGLGAVQWSADETHLLIKRSPERKSGDLVWISLPPLAGVAGIKTDLIPVIQPEPLPILHSLTFRDFAISPDGHTLAVILPGRRNLELFPLPSY